MSNLVTRIKQFRPATLIAMLALFVAIGGTATAASGLINGKKIKNNTVTGKKLKNRTITKNKLAPATVKALKGQQGPKGDTGQPGKDGVVSPTYQEFGSTNIVDGNELAIGTVNVPAGKYMVTATANTFALGSGRTECFVTTNNGGGSSETSSWNSTAANVRNALPVVYVTDTDTVTSITLGCGIDDTNGSVGGSMIVTPVK